MKLVFIFGIALLGTIYASIEDSKDSPSFYESQVELAELLKDERVVRMLEPEITEIIKSILNKINDPLNTTYTHIPINLLNGTLNLDWNITDWYMVGAQDYVIDPLSFNILPKISMSVGLLYNGVHGTGGYNISGTILNLIPVWGSGIFDTAFSGLAFATDVNIKPRAGQYLEVDSISIFASIQEVLLNISNLYGGDLGIVIQEIIAENIKDYVDRIMYAYKPNLEEFIKKEVNDLIGNMTVQDLIDYIRNPPTKAPTEAPIQLF